MRDLTAHSSQLTAHTLTQLTAHSQLCDLQLTAHSATMFSVHRASVHPAFLVMRIGSQDCRRRAAAFLAVVAISLAVVAAVAFRRDFRKCLWSCAVSVFCFCVCSLTDVTHDTWEAFYCAPLPCTPAALDLTALMCASTPLAVPNATPLQYPQAWSLRFSCTVSMCVFRESPLHP